MAITQVRVKLGDTWTVLTYNAATGRYEGTLTPPGTSINQPGGYYSLTVEAVNSSGQTDRLTGERYAGLRLVVREDVAPTLTLLSPPQGWLTTSAPTVVFQAQDEAGGSGIDPASAQASIDGAAVPCTVTEAGGAYRVTIAATGLPDGPHTVTAAISDQDGNTATASAAYTVDTAPPVITMISPNLHRIVDWSEVEVAGVARDAVSGLAAVTVGGTAVTPSTGGHFSRVVPLEVGVNQIAVAATDQAGLTSTQTIWMLRMVTDRTPEDVSRIAALLSKRWADFTAAERALWQGAVRGAYNADDLNRVGTAVEHIAAYLETAGYAPDVSPKTDWTDPAAPTRSQRQTYLDNVARIRALLPLAAPQLPPNMDALDTGQANDIETILVSADRLIPLMEQTGWRSGEIMAGEM